MQRLYIVLILIVHMFKTNYYILFSCLYFYERTGILNVLIEKRTDGLSYHLWRVYYEKIC